MFFVDFGVFIISYSAKAAEADPENNIVREAEADTENNIVRERAGVQKKTQQELARTNQIPGEN